MLSELSLLVLLSLLLCGCQPSTFDREATFDEFHQSIGRYSASVDTRSINWDGLYETYRPQVNEDLSDPEFFSLIRELLLEFRDPHVQLITPFDTMYTIQELGYTPNFNSDLLPNYVNGLDNHTFSIRSGTINDSIGYLQCLDFKGDTEANNAIYTMLIRNWLVSTKGLIIDLRNNDGGSVYNVQNLLAKFTNRRTLWHRSQNRTTEGFDQPYDWFLEPDPALFYSLPIVVLTGRFTISAGERFALGVPLLDNALLMGDSTSNTQGSVMGREMLNGWKYTFTFEKVLNANGVNYGGIGVPPMEYFASSDAIAGQRDLLLERAIEVLE